MAKCYTCGYEGEPKEGSVNLCPKCLCNKMRDFCDGEKPSDLDTTINAKMPDMEGSITFRSREAIINFVSGLIDQHDLTRDELGL